MGINVTSSTNDSIIRPVGFYVIGFAYLQRADLYIIFLGFIYIVTILCNSFLIFIISIDNRLHVPKYIAVANLGVVDLVSSTSFIPSSIKTYISKDSFMSYNACLTQMVFFYSFISLGSFSLCVLAYDRLIAICFPLRHSSINTCTSMISVLVVVWAFNIGSIAFMVALLEYLSFCDSLSVYSYHCDYGAVYRLSCNDNTLQFVTASCLSITNLCVPVILIVTSYACILRAVFRMKNVESRYKALATCTEHLFLVAIFYVPTITLYMVEIFVFRFDPDVRMLSLSLASCIPSCVNPVVYTLATKDIRTRIFTMLQKVNVAAWAGRT